MHKSTKITPVLRKEIFTRWKGGEISQRQLAREYHVDKRIVGKIIERGNEGDFSVHTSTNKRYLKKPVRAGNIAKSPTSLLSNKKKSVVKKIQPKKSLAKKTGRKV